MLHVRLILTGPRLCTGELFSVLSADSEDPPIHLTDFLLLTMFASLPYFQRHGCKLQSR